MTTKQPVLLKGNTTDGITLEGPLLEQLWAAYQLHRHATVAPRYTTLGIHHDVLTSSGAKQYALRDDRPALHAQGQG